MELALRASKSSQIACPGAQLQLMTLRTCFVFALHSDSQMATLEEVDVGGGMTLEECSKYVHLTRACDALLQKASDLISRFDSASTNNRRRVFMVNSTAQGGGVAEMLPRMIQLFRGVGLESKWLVIAPTAGARDVTIRQTGGKREPYIRAQRFPCFQC